MEESKNGHIGSAELARLLEESRGLVDPLQDAAERHPHLAACSSCREQFQDLALLERHVVSMKRTELAEFQSDCPPPGLWREIAGGLTPPEETLIRIEHASRCDHCGPLLHEAVSELGDVHAELTGAERKHIASLESAREEWQKRLARQITGAQPEHESASWWQKWLGIPRLAMAGATVLAMVGVGSWIILHERQIRRDRPAAAAQLLARAYTDQRTLELRMAGANYAPLRVSRGPSGSFLTRSSALLKAEVLIAGQLESHPTDPSWVQAQADADVLEGKYEPAVEALRRALELEPNSPALLTDLATAYFQLGLQQDRNEDFASAFEYLSQSLKLRPDDPVALFNRAIVSEHQFLYQQALDDWEHYLRVDPGSQWADEARNRASALRDKLKKHQSKATPLLSPEQIVLAASGASPPPEIDDRIEEYLHEAVRSWLSEAFPEVGTNEARAAANKLNTDRALQALFFLADLTNERHGDRWLSDLLRGSSAPHFAVAANELARAVKANDAGEYSVSRSQAHRAEQSFLVSGDTAGVLRARFEELFAVRNESHSEECRQEATATLPEAEKYSYPWLQIQLGLEKAVCSGLMSNLGTYHKATQRAMDRAQESKYEALYLRALGFSVNYESSTGDRSGAAKLANTGLKVYWSAQYPAVRAYNLYTELALLAESEGQSNLQMTIWGEAVALIDSGENLLMRALVHNAMADAAAAAHLPQIAKQQYSEAARLFAAAPRSEASRNDALETQVRTAQIEVHQAQFDDAHLRLTGIQEQVRALSNNYLLEIFYTTLGESQLGRQRNAEAEQTLRTALGFAEQNLATLRTDAERTSWSKSAAPAYLALVEAELAQGRSEEALETYESYLGAPQRVAIDSAREPQTNPGFPETSRMLSRLPLLTKETVLSYAVLPNGLAIWAYDNRGVHTQWIEKSTDRLQELAERFHELCSDPKSELSALRRDARSLYGELVTPVQPFLTPGRTLIIEAEGWLARVPLEALLDDDNHYLIERTALVHSLGQDSEARLRNDTNISADLPALVVGGAASSPADGLIPLPDVAAEADAIASDFHFARVLKGKAATPTAIRSELPRAAVFHFAGHALATPGRTGLMLEGAEGQGNVPSLVDAHFLQQLQPNRLQLAVLSACSTASGSGGSSGFDNVTDALLRTGVPHVVASRWAVDSTETRRFVEDFYRNALSGQAVSDALRLTARNMLARLETSHPYYWSAFAAYGLP